jgi:hypothetical protein
MVVNANAPSLTLRGVLRLIASQLAPTQKRSLPTTGLFDIPRYKLDTFFTFQPV